MNWKKKVVVVLAIITGGSSLGSFMIYQQQKGPVLATPTASANSDLAQTKSYAISNLTSPFSILPTSVIGATPPQSNQSLPSAPMIPMGKIPTPSFPTQAPQNPQYAYSSPAAAVASYSNSPSNPPISYNVPAAPGSVPSGRVYLKSVIYSSDGSGKNWAVFSDGNLEIVLSEGQSSRWGTVGSVQRNGAYIDDTYYTLKNN